MDLTRLFEIQRKLDAEIEEKHPTYEGENRFRKRILALQVELGELANELPEIFKFWSNKKNNYPKALEELVDCWHFVLSIGNHLEFNIETDFEYTIIARTSAEDLFNDLFMWTSTMRDYDNLEDCNHNTDFNYIYQLLKELGETIGFTWEEVVEAYMSKNKTNWERQANGY